MARISKDREISGLRFVKLSEKPEQWEIRSSSAQAVGYARLSGGRFVVFCPSISGERILEVLESTLRNGVFAPDGLDRELLPAAAEAVLRYYAEPKGRIEAR